MAVSDPVLTVRDVAGRVGLSEWAVRRAIADGQLVAYKPRGRLRVTEDDLAAWIASTRVVPTAADVPPIPRISVRKQRSIDLQTYELSA